MENKNLIAYKSNWLIREKGAIIHRDVLTECEQKIVTYMASQVKEDSKSEDRYEIDFHEYLKIANISPCGDVYTDILKSVNNLLKKTIMFVDGDGVVKGANFINSPIFPKKGKKRIVSYKLDENLLPHYKAFASGFTIIKLLDYMSIRGKYPIALYEFLLSWKNKGKVECSLDDLLKIMNIPKSYLTADALRRVSASIKEINQKSKIMKIKMEEQRGARRKVDSIIFTIIDLENKSDKHINNYSKVDISGKIKEVIFKKNFLKVIIDVPSPEKKGLNGGSYISSIPLVAFGEQAQSIISSVDLKKDKFVLVEGMIINYKRDLAKSTQYIKEEQIELLADLLNITTNNLIIQDIFEVLGKSTYPTRFGTSVLINKICNIDEEKSMEENNRVEMQGCIYMPPSFRPTTKTESYALHFKTIINRDEELQSRLKGSVEMNRDQVNVMAFGNKAKEYFQHLEQGYPVKIIGRLESDRYKGKNQATKQQYEALANFFNKSTNDPLIEKVLIVCGVHNSSDSFIKHDLWANTIYTIRK